MPKLTLTYGAMCCELFTPRTARGKELEPCSAGGRVEREIALGSGAP